MSPQRPASFTSDTKFCMVPELFAIPTPERVRDCFARVVMVKALAPALNTMLFTSVARVTKMAVVLERSKVAVSVDPFGTVFGIQLIGVFQSELVGLRFQVA